MPLVVSIVHLEKAAGTSVETKKKNVAVNTQERIDNMGATYKNGKIKIYTIRDIDGTILFSGTAKDAVKQGKARSQQELRNRVYAIIQNKATLGGMTAEITEQDIKVLKKEDKYQLSDKNLPCCILEDVCPGFRSKLNFSPCCRFCEYYEVCADKCVNNPAVCSCFCKEGSDKYINAYDTIMKDAL